MFYNYFLHGHKFCSHCGYPCRVIKRETSKGVEDFIECTEFSCMLRNIMINTSNLETFPHWLYGSEKRYDNFTGNPYIINFSTGDKWQDWLNSFQGMV